MTKWTPDTCHCIIDFEGDMKFVGAVEKCKLHKNLDGQPLLDAVMNHNREVSKDMPDKPTKKQLLDYIVKAKQEKEKTRN